jgi:glutamine---fructose-6-phosphate transaminase (isomerizing)
MVEGPPKSKKVEQESATVVHDADHDPYLRDVLEQPELLTRIAHSFVVEDRQTLSAVRQWFWRGEHHLIVFTGVGSSLFAAQAIIPTLNKIGIRAVAFEMTELLHHGIPSLAGKVAVVVVSETGDEPEVRALVKALKGRVGILGIVCVAGSFLASTADLVVRVPLQNGPRGTGIGGYTGTIGVLRLLAHVLAGGVVDQVTTALFRAAESIDRYLDHGLAAIGALADVIRPETLLYLTGTGPSAASVHQGSLLIKRVSHRQAEGVLGGHLVSEAIDLVGQDRVVIAFAPHGPAFGSSQALVERLGLRGSRMVVVTNGKPSEFAPASTVIQIDYDDDAIAPLVEIVPIQILAHDLRQNSAPVVGR